QRPWVGRTLEVVRHHPLMATRLAVLDDPRLLPVPGVLAAFGAGLAIAVGQANLNSLAVQLLVTVNTDASLAQYPWVLILTTGLTVVLLAGLAVGAVSGRVVRGTGSNAVLLPGLALAAGLVLGEPLSLFFGDAGVWGLLDGAGTTGLVGASVSVALL